MTRHQRRPRRHAGTLAIEPFHRLESVLQRLEPLDAEQLDDVHRASMQVLADHGMRVLSPLARQHYRLAGCQVDDDSMIVRIGADVVDHAVSTAPTSFTLRARNPDKSLHVGGNSVVFCSVGGPAFVHDLVRGRRAGTFTEQCDFIRLVQSIGILHQEGGGPFEALDLPAATRHLDLYSALIRLMDKNWQAIALGRDRAADAIDMAAIALGTNREGLASDPAVLAIVNTNSPLTLDQPMAEGLIELAGAGQAVCVTPFTLAGAMAPATVGGALVQQNAEALAGVVLTQLVRPGAPVMYGSFTSNVDMRTGSPAFGGPEYVKATQASGQLARRYGLPFRSSNVTSANSVDAQAAYESQMSLWAALTGGAHLVYHAAGWLEGGLTASFEKLIIDAEMLQMMAATVQPIATDDDSLAVSAIAEVGHGGHFFGAEHTMARYERAFYRPLVTEGRNYESWRDAGAPDTAQRAYAIWQQLLAEYEQPPLDPDVEEQLREFVDRRRIELAE